MTVADVLLAVVLLIHAGVLAVLAVNLLAFARDRRRPLPTDLPSVSVLVPARNEEDTLRLLLPTLLAPLFLPLPRLPRLRQRHLLCCTLPLFLILHFWWEVFKSHSGWNSSTCSRSSSR